MESYGNANHWQTISDCSRRYNTGLDGPQAIVPWIPPALRDGNEVESSCLCAVQPYQPGPALRSIAAPTTGCGPAPEFRGYRPPSSGVAEIAFHVTTVGANLVFALLASFSHAPRGRTQGSPLRPFAEMSAGAEISPGPVSAGNPPICLTSIKSFADIELTMVKARGNLVVPLLVTSMDEVNHNHAPSYH